MSMFKKYLEKKAAVHTLMTEMIAKAEKEDRAFTAEEEAQYSELDAELKAAVAMIERIKGLEQTQSTSAAPPAASSAALLEPKVLQAMPTAPKDFQSFGEQLHAIITNPRDARLEYHSEIPNAEQNTGEGAKGGFLIRPQFDPRFLEIAPSEALVRPRAMVIPAGTPPDAEYSINALDQEPTSGGANQVYAGVLVDWTEEGGELAATDWKVREITLKPKTVGARIPFTIKQLQNAAATASITDTMLRRAILGAEDHAFITGSGAGKPEGILVGGGCVKVNRATTTTFKYTDAKKMRARFRGTNGIWIIGSDAFAQVLDMVGDGDGATNVFNPNLPVEQQRLLGFPIYVHDRVPALGVLGDVMLADLSQYIIKDGSGLFIERGYASGQWERHKESIKAVWNVDGRSWQTKPYKNEQNYEVSYVVALDVPAA